MKKLFFILATMVLLISTACEGTFIDPGMMDSISGGGSGGLGGNNGSGDSGGGSSYTIIFDINGGTGTTPAKQTGSLGSSIIMPGGNGFSKEGFYFAGWNTNAAGTGFLSYSAGESYSISSNTTMYAKWNSGSATNYTVTFNINGGSGTAPDSHTVPSNFSTTLPGGSGLSRDGYIFGGWNTNNSGTGTNYSAGATFYVRSSNVTLYAKWSYTGVGGEENPIPLTANVWKDDEITTSTTDRQLWYSFSVTQGTTYYVWWNDRFTGAGDGTKTGDIYVSAYYSNGTSIFTGGDNGWTTAQSFTASSTTTVKLRVYPYGSYFGTFAIVYSTNSTRPNTGLTYTVTFSNNGGSGDAITSMSGLDGSTITLPSGDGLSKTDAMFGGWNTSATGTGTNYDAGASYTIINGNVTLYAKWNALCTVTFNSNGGTGTVSSQQQYSGSSITLPSGDGLSRDDYAFGSWNTNAAGTGTTYSVGASYTVNGNVTLYAKWYSTAPGAQGNPLPLTANTWADGNLPLATSVIWYSFNVTQGITYYVWWNDKLSGPTPKDKTGDVEVIAYYSDESAVSEWTSVVDSGWTTAKSFTASKNGTVLLRVRPYNANSLYIGTFGITYSTTNTRPTP